MNDAKKRRFDAVLVWRFDRFARSTKHLILALEEFRNLGVDFVSYQENIDTSSPLGSAIFTIISAVAQLERDIIAERVKAGLRRAVEGGKRLGRPNGTSLDVEAIYRLRSEGWVETGEGEREEVGEAKSGGAQGGDLQITQSRLEFTADCYSAKHLKKYGSQISYSELTRVNRVSAELQDFFKLCGNAKSVV